MRRRFKIFVLLFVISIAIFQLLIFKSLNKENSFLYRKLYTESPKIFHYSFDITRYNGIKNRHEKYFECIYDHQLIPIASFNDDYCDCEDGSDEPTTSACSGSKFYCKTQLSLIKGKIEFLIHYVYSTQVNDGINDCCDGSDEWKNIEQNYNVCSGIQHKIYSSNENLIHGKKLKGLYLKKGVSGTKDKMYGTYGEYYALSLKCLQYTSFEYIYKVCPFHSITQTKMSKDSVANGASFVLGKDSKWSKIKNAMLIMSGGNPDNCPLNGNVDRGRISELVFSCGQDRVDSVRETDICLYTFNIETPAAC